MRKEQKLRQLEFEFMKEIKSKEEREIKKERWEYHKGMLISVIPALPAGVVWYLIVNKPQIIRDCYDYIRGLFEGVLQ